MVRSQKQEVQGRIKIPQKSVYNHTRLRTFLLLTQKFAVFQALPKKQAGISLFLATGISLLVLTIATYVFVSVQKSFDQTRDLELSTQFFYASESGIEAGLFHKNARGRGSHLSYIQTDGTLDTTARDNNFRLPHPKTNLNTYWYLNGRAKSTSKSEIIGTLKENEAIDIPLYFDQSSDNPKSSPTTFDLKTANATNQLELSFYRYEPSLNLDLSGYQFNNILTVDETLIDWSLSCYDQASDTGGHNNYYDGYLSFIPSPIIAPNHPDDLTVCGTSPVSPSNGGVDSSFVCETDLPFSLDLNTKGLIQPCSSNTPGKTYNGDPTDPNAGCAADLTHYLHYCDRETTVSFRPLVPYENTLGQRIPGIPYKLTFNTPSPYDVAKPYFDINSYVQSGRGQFDQTINVQIKEKTTSKSFDYVIFQ